MPTAIFGITDDSLNLVVNLLILVFVVIWVALVWWTYADARRRISDPVLIATATAASLFPFIGTIVYSILRPPEFLADARERELETKAAELRLRHLTESSCPRCEHPVELSWLRCPECRHRLKDPCVSCGRPVDPRWAICPSCETPLAEPARANAPAQQRSRKRQAAAQAGERERPAAARPGGERRTKAAKQQPKRRTAPAEPTAEASSPRQPAAKQRERPGRQRDKAQESERVPTEAPQHPPPEPEQRTASPRQPTPES